MRLAWELFINVIEVFIIYDFLVRYFGYRVTGAARYAGTILAAGTAFLIVSVISYAVPFEMLSTILTAGVNFIFCTLVLKGSIFEKAFISVFIMAVVNVIAVGTALIFSNIQNTEIIYIFARFDLMRMTAMVTTKVVLFALTRLILHLRFKAKLSFQEFIMLAMLPSFSLAAMAVLMPIALKNPQIQNRILAAVIIIAVMNGLVYYLFFRISRGNRIRQDYALLRLQYVSEQKRVEEVRQLYEEIRSVRHDLRNHLLCIDLLAQQNKCGEIRDYIEGFSRDVPDLEKQLLFTGNDILDAILHAKVSLAEQEGIHCEVEVSYSELPMTRGDISVLMGNLLDNAYEAARNAGVKEISVYIVRQGNYVSIRVQNTVAAPVLSQNPDLETSKEDKSVHGLGTKNIQKIVEKYGGILEYHEEENLFLCDILIPLDTNLDA